jgi:hypothetical protein
MDELQDSSRRVRATSLVSELLIDRGSDAFYAHIDVVQRFGTTDEEPPARLKSALER